MTSVSRDNFGFLIAYVIPGFTVVAVISARSETISEWLGFHTSTTASVGGFLYVTVASMMAGMTLSALRWLFLDRIHLWTGIKPPDRDFSSIHEKRDALEYLVDMHYRYYEFFGHMFLSVLCMLANIPLLSRTFAVTAPLLVALLSFLAAVFFVASRDTLRKYYQRTAALLNH